MRRSRRRPASASERDTQKSAAPMGRRREEEEMFGRVFSILAVLALSACSVDTIDDGDVNQEKLYGDYRVTFDDAEKQVRHYVQFRVGGSTGTTIRLTEGSIEYDGNEMSVFDGDEALINLNGTYYRRTYSADMPNASYTYTWTRGDGQRFDNIATMPSPFTIAAPLAGDTLPLDVPLTISLDGDPLGPNEVYSVQIESEAAMGQNMIAARSESGTEVIISADELSGLPLGPAIIRVSRVRSDAPQAGHADVGGRIETQYQVGEIGVSFVASQPVG